MTTPENKTIMTFHEQFRQYDLGEGHPFRGDRFANAMRFFESQGLLSLSEIVFVEVDNYLFHGELDFLPIKKGARCLLVRGFQCAL